MLNRRVSFILIVLLAAATPVFANQTVLAQNQLDIKNVRLMNNYTFKPVRAKVLQPRDTQAATAKVEDGDPTGPNNEVSPTYLADKFEPLSPKYIRADFENHIPFSDELFRDHTSLNTYYFYPAGYLLNYDKTDGFDINFLHRTRTDDSSDELIMLTFSLEPRRLGGSISLMQELARYAIKPANDKPVDLQRLPISSVKVNMAGLSSLIPEKNVKIINQPQRVGDRIRVQALMTQSQKEDVVASIRSGGLAGDIVFKTNNNSFELVIPYFVSFTEFAGDWMSDITQMATTESIKNQSPYPLIMSGVVVYARAAGGDQMKRHFVPLNKPAVIDAGGMARADKTYSQLVSSFGEVVAAWPSFERVSCDECLNAVERDILVSPAQASRTDLPIEAIPNIFSNFSLFKVLVEVRSKHFSPSNEFAEVKNFTLRPDAASTTATLYINREENSDNGFEYRIKPYHEEGLDLGVTDWKSSDGVMDITITAGDIRPLMPEE